MRICVLTKDHYQELSVFLEGQTNGIISRDVWMDRFPCFWENSPFFKEGTDQRGWAVIDDQGRIGGFFGSIPMLYYHQGREQIVNVASSWYVEPSCRRHSLGLFRAFLKTGRAQMCTTPSPDVTFIFKKIGGFRSFEAEWLDRNYFFPIDSREFSEFLRPKLFKNRITSAFSVGIMPLLSLGIDFYKFLYKFRWPEEKAQRYLVREIDTFGPEYDTFWEKLRVKFDILAVRNRIALNWLFLGTSQLKSERKILEVRKQQELIGYVAVKEVVRQAEGNKNLRYYEMIDAALLEDNKELFSEIMGKIKLLAYQNRVSFIKIPPLVSYWKSILKERGFISMIKESRFVYKDLAPLENLRCWLTPLDGDRGFF